MPFVHTDWWSLDVPDDWIIERDDDSGVISIADPDELGCIDLLVLESDTAIDTGAGNASDNLLSLATAALAHAQILQQPEAGVTLGQFNGVVSRFVEDGSVWREWYLGGEGFVLVVSHNTDVEHQGLDDGIVDDILATLVVEAA